jgi:hypothetical protein
MDDQYLLITLTHQNSQQMVIQLVTSHLILLAHCFPCFPELQHQLTLALVWESIPYVMQRWNLINLKIHGDDSN